MEKNKITQSIMIAATTLIAAFAWESLENIFISGKSWIWAGSSFFILLVFLSLTWILSESKSTSLINMAAIYISFLFIFGFELAYLPILAISFGLFFFGAYRALDEKKARLKIQLFSILKKGMPITITGLALIISAAYYFSPMGQTGDDKISIPEPLFELIADPLIKNIESQLPTNPLSQELEVDASKRQQIKDLLYERMNQEINRYSQKYQEYFPLGLSIGVFFAIKTIGFFVIYLIIFLAFIIFKLLVHFKAVKIQEESVLKQVIEV